MSDVYDRGITVTEMAAMDDPVDVHPKSAAAFIGRALRGPINTPVLVRSLADFGKRFGGVWPKSSLGPAVQQFFEHGGRRLYVVRVANGATRARVEIPTGEAPLVLTAVDPGSAETIRVSVDYDRLPPDDSEHFNLTVQRMAPGGSMLVDQEIHDRLSCSPSSDRFIGDRLYGSSLVRVVAPIPASRPSATIGPRVRRGDGYLLPNKRGDDGAELSDYDLIGSAKEQSGIFALEGVEKLDLLYLPPAGRGRDVGPAAITAADLYCRRRGAMLVVDPPRAWSSADDAVRGTEGLGLASSNMLSYFPRVLDRENPHLPSRAAGGALAGLICRFDDRVGPWCDPSETRFALNSRYRPALDIREESLHRLVNEGLNVLASQGGRQAILHGGVTLARQSPCQKQFTRLAIRRLCLHIGNAVGAATRWALFSGFGGRVEEQVRRQVYGFLARLYEEGAISSDRFDVQCQQLHPDNEAARTRGFAIVVGFQPVGQPDYLWLTLHQDLPGCHTTATAFAPSVQAAAP